MAASTVDIILGAYLLPRIMIVSSRFGSHVACGPSLRIRYAFAAHPLLQNAFYMGQPRGYGEHHCSVLPKRHVDSGTSEYALSNFAHRVYANSGHVDVKYCLVVRVAAVETHMNVSGFMAFLLYLCVLKFNIVISYYRS